MIPQSWPRQLLQYDEPKTWMKLVKPWVVEGVAASGGSEDCCGEAEARGLSENSKPLCGFPCFAARSICTCCKVDGAPSDLTWRRAAAGVANSYHSATGS